ncbi:MAG: zinc-binding dehydrogenase [Acidimicrobiales bacterium]
MRAAVLTEVGKPLEIRDDAEVEAPRAGEVKVRYAVDLHPSKLRQAVELGATATVDASAGDPVARVRELTGERGVDVAFEVIGMAATIDQTIAMTRRGGTPCSSASPGWTPWWSSPPSSAWYWRPRR